LLVRARHETAAIVGAGDYIGAAIARKFAAEGFMVFAALVQDPAVKAELRENTERSVARGSFGSPTFSVGDTIYFGNDRLREVEEAIFAAR
jgi:2-hydroxychromene-2-carboxylate isomerase